jgi:hypothetical protein
VLGGRSYSTKQAGSSQFVRSLHISHSACFGSDKNVLKYASRNYRAVVESRLVQCQHHRNGQPFRFEDCMHSNAGEVCRLMNETCSAQQRLEVFRVVVMICKSSITTI